MRALCDQFKRMKGEPMTIAVLRQRLAGLGIALGVVCVASAAPAQTAEAYKGNAAGPRVAVIGDSITWQTKE
jgi:hypothetical protein